jgi:hypothetical protein
LILYSKTIASFCCFQSSEALLFELKWQIVLKVAAAAAAAARFKGFLKPKAIPPAAFFVLLQQQEREA